MSRSSITQALTRKFNLASDVDLSAYATKLPPNLSGADLYAFCASALTKALHERVDALNKEKAEKGGATSSRFGGLGKKASIWDDDDDEEEEGEEEESEESEDSDEEGVTKAKPVPEGGELIVYAAHFEAAVAELSPSVSKEQAARYQQLRKQFEGGNIDSELSLDPEGKPPPAMPASSAMRVVHR